MDKPTNNSTVFSAQAQTAIDKQRRILADSVLKIRISGTSIWLLLALIFGLSDETSSYRAQIPHVFTYVSVALLFAVAYKRFPTIPFLRIFTDG